MNTSQVMAREVSWNEIEGGENIVLNAVCRSHLSKDPSDLTQKCTQLPIPILGPVFNALSHGMIHFVRSVSLRNRYLIG